MSRQCRICLEDNNPDGMIAPCRCRGSAEFIHELCLEEYIRHFPDGVCRVCRAPMVKTNETELFFQILLYFWFSFMISFANIPFHTKLAYTVMLTAVFVYTTPRRILGYWTFVTIFALSFLFVFIEPAHLVKAIFILGALAMVFTTCYYVPPQFVLLTATIGLVSVYATALTMYVATTTDSYMTSYFVGLLATLWFTFTHARPPFHAIN